MSNNIIIWGTLILFAIIWLVLAWIVDDKDVKEHYITRSQIFVAASFISLI